MYLNRSIRIPRTHRVNWAVIGVWGACAAFWMGLWMWWAW